MTETSLDRNRLDTVLADICRKADLDPTGARLIKFTNNAVLELARAPVVVRIAGSQTVRDRVPKVVAVARWLATHNMPAVRLYAEVPQPIRAGVHLATLWHRVSSDGATPDGRDLGHILLRYHALPNPDPPLPAWQPISPIRQRLTETVILTEDELGFLRSCCDELEEALDGLAFRLPPGPVHGDATVANLISSRDGPVICDFDSAANGPREWDLTPVAVGRIRFGQRRDSQERLAATYGVDVTRWPGFPVLRRLRELQLVTSVIPVLRSNPALAAQWRHRLTTFRTGELHAAWIPYR